MTSDDLPKELARIAGLDTDALRSLWLKMTGLSPSRQLSGDLLRRMIMHRVQERCLGALDRKLAAMLDRLADGSGTVPARLKLGSVLVREHNGVVHQIMVVQGSFAWQDRVFPSLSAVAQAITGTKWNGYRFFGLRKTELAMADGRGADQGEAEADLSGIVIGQAETGRSGQVVGRAHDQLGGAHLVEVTP